LTGLLDRREEDRVAALDRGRNPPAGRRRTRVFVTAAGVGAAVTLVVTGPPRPVSFDVRLPLLVLGIGALWTAATRRRTAGGGKRAAVPMATPWLLFTSTVGIGLLTARLLAGDPALSGALLAIGAAASCLALGACLAGGRRGGPARPDHAGPLASGAPGQPVSAVGVDAGREFGVEQ
jgi:hypothetical protein